MSEHPQESTKSKENLVYVMKNPGQVYYRETYHQPGERVSILGELLYRTYGDSSVYFTEDWERMMRR